MTDCPRSTNLIADPTSSEYSSDVVLDSPPCSWNREFKLAPATQGVTPAGYPRPIFLTFAIVASTIHVASGSDPGLAKDIAQPSRNALQDSPAITGLTGTDDGPDFSAAHSIGPAHPPPLLLQTSTLATSASV
ncbi:hypothetical protein FS749_003333 [Ceratobasidium sp. UAMH 11750]|nr:hypothetical protein FS749_003333 [Ceratobasidium sp. UAMH 11750]